MGREIQYYTHRGVTLVYARELWQDAYQVYGYDLCAVAEKMIDNLLGPAATDRTLGTELNLTFTKNTTPGSFEFSIQGEIVDKT